MSGPRAALLLHGIGATARDLEPLAEDLKAAGWQVESPTLKAELRPKRRPPAALARVCLKDYVDEASAAARALAQAAGGLPAVVGHSLGGLLAQKVLEAGLARAGVLLAPASPADARSGRGPTLAQAITFLNIMLATGREERPHRIWGPGYRWGVLNRVPARDRHALYERLAVYDSGRVYADVAFPDKDPSRSASVETRAVTQPLLVLAGRHDRTTPLGDMRRVGAKYPQADYRELAGHGHFLLGEPGSERVRALVIGWMDGLS